MVGWLLSRDGLLLCVALPALFNWLAMCRAMQRYRVIRHYRYMSYHSNNKEWARVGFPFQEHQIRAAGYQSGIVRKDVLKLAIMRSVPGYSLLVNIAILFAMLLDGIDSLMRPRRPKDNPVTRAPWSLRGWLNERVM
jgi:hypothetical protein